ncbi:MAG: hypothetical protein EOO07_30370, partial [Chitinophagaceae bacterium]
MNRNALQDASLKESDLKQQIISTQNTLDRQRIKAEIKALYSFSGSITLTNIFIPHLSCNDVTITRTYNTQNEGEELEIFLKPSGRPEMGVEGMANELF